MPAAPYATRYARALADVLGHDESALDAANRELRDFAAAFDKSHDLHSVFIDPSIPASKKVEIIDRLRPKLELSQSVRNFLAVIANHERMEGFHEILSAFEAIVRGEENVAEIEWISARALSQDEQNALKQRLAELTGQRIEASFKQDSGLLGGARLRIGSTVYDGSVRGRLEDLREKLVAS